VSLFINEIEGLSTLLDQDFTLIYGSNAEGNIELAKKSPSDAPFILYEVSDPITPEITASGTIVGAVPMNFLFFDFDEQGSRAIDTARIQHLMMMQAIKFGRIIDEARLPFRNNNINVSIQSVLPVQHLLDDDVSGVLLNITVPVVFPVTFCAPDNWEDIC